MKEVVKYTALIVLGYLAYYHLQEEATPIMHCLYFMGEYLMIGSVFVYLATIFNGKERWFFAILGGYFAFKMVYNTLVYHPILYIKLGLNNSEFWGFIFTGIVIVSLIIIQFRYVKER